MCPQQSSLSAETRGSGAEVRTVTPMHSPSQSRSQARRWGRELLRGLGYLAGACLLGVVLLRLSGWSEGPVSAVLLVGAPVVLLGGYPLALLAAGVRDRGVGALALVSIIAHIAVLLPGLGAAEIPPRQAGTPLRVVSANLLLSNPTPARAVAAIAAARPDVLVVVELSPPALRELSMQGVLRALPHTTLTPGDRRVTRDVEIFSRYPLRDISRTPGFPGAAQLSDPRAVVEIQGIEVRIRGAHPLPPLGSYEEWGRDSLRTLRRELQEEELPVIVAGDLNADRDQPLFHDLLEAGMRDAAEERGRGWSRTWPRRLPLLALDHILVRDGRGGRIYVRSQSEIDLPGSDHRGVVAELLLQSR